MQSKLPATPLDSFNLVGVAPLTRQNSVLDAHVGRSESSKALAFFGSLSFRVRRMRSRCHLSELGLDPGNALLDRGSLSRR